MVGGGEGDERRGVIGAAAVLPCDKASQLGMLFILCFFYFPINWIRLISSSALLYFVITPTTPCYAIHLPPIPIKIYTSPPLAHFSAPLPGLSPLLTPFPGTSLSASSTSSG
jgi:hypothetical protein